MRNEPLPIFQTTVTLEPRAEHLPALLDRFAELGALHGSDALKRVTAMIEIGLGRRARSYREPGYRPVTLCMPELQPKRFHDLSAGPLREVKDALARAFPQVRQEALRLLASPEIFSSFIEQAHDPLKIAMPPEHWREAYLRNGPLPAMNARVRELCPVTAATLDSIAHHLDGDASFSVLHPGAVIPAHHGEINYRLTGHLPLVVAGDCGLEAGGERRAAREGDCFVFDDAFIHHAWNLGPSPRIHLLFMLWNPEVTAAERLALAAVRQAFTRRPHGDTEQLVQLMVDQRIAERGRAPGSLDEVGAAAFACATGRLRAALDELAREPVRGRLALLDALRRAELFPQLDWQPATRAAFIRDQPLVSRDPETFCVMKGAAPASLVIEYRDRHIEIEPPWIALVEEALSGRPFHAHTLVTRLGYADAAAHALGLLEALHAEGLLAAEAT
jgi:hypothetical protein